MTQVRIRRNETSESLIKRFVRKVKKSNILKEVNERRYYRKPSEKKRQDFFKRRAVQRVLKEKEIQNNKEG